MAEEYLGGLILLLSPPRFWGYRHSTPCQVYVVTAIKPLAGDELRTLQVLGKHSELHPRTQCSSFQNTGNCIEPRPVVPLGPPRAKGKEDSNKVSLSHACSEAPEAAAVAPYFPQSCRTSTLLGLTCSGLGLGVPTQEQKQEGDQDCHGESLPSSLLQRPAVS